MGEHRYGVRIVREMTESSVYGIKGEWGEREREREE